MNKPNYTWKINVRRIPGTLTSQVFLWRDSNNGTNKIEVMSFRNDGLCKSKTTDPMSTDNIPTITAEDREFDEIVNAFVDYAKSQNMRSTDESHMAGKLVATEKHLEDMRSLVFKDKNHE